MSAFIADEILNPFAVAIMRDWADGFMASKPADLVIGRGSNDVPYMERWFITRSFPERGETFPCFYVHRFSWSDQEELHDHPWDNLSIVLRGSYVEDTPAGQFTRAAGHMVGRSATDTHAIRSVEPGTVTLFMTGPRLREWGFHTAEGFVHHDLFRTWKDGREGQGRLFE